MSDRFPPADLPDFRCGRCGTLLDGGTDEPVAARGLRQALNALQDAVEGYLLWEPGRAGHAAAHRRLVEAVRESQGAGNVL